MKVTRLGYPRPVMSLAGVLSGGTAGQAPVANGSNGVEWQDIVQRITSNTSNTVLGPFVNFASGSNTIFSVSSNTLTIGTTGGISAQDEGVSLGTADTFNFTGAGVQATGAGGTKTVNIPGGTGSLTAFPNIVQSKSGNSGVGTPSVTIVQPATTSLIIVIGAVNGTGPSGVALTNFTMTQRRNDGFGGVGDIFIWTGVYDGSGTPGTSVTFSGASSALSVAHVIEVADHGFGSMGSSSTYAQTSLANSRGTAQLTPASGSIVAFIVHTAAASATGIAVLSCPFVANVEPSGQATSFGIALGGMPVTGYYPAAASQDYTLAEIVLS